MFSGLAKRFKKPNALNEIFESRVKEIDRSDFLALVSLYLAIFIPSRVGDAAKYVSKYKV